MEKIEVYKTALGKSNVALKLLMEYVTDNQKELIKRTIENNERLIEDRPIKVRPNSRRPKKQVKEQVEHYIEPDRIKEDLLKYGLYTEEEIEERKPYSLINQLRNFREANSSFYYFVLDKIGNWLKSNTPNNKESYIIGTFNKERKKAGRL